MHRKLLGICLALAAFALVPATASATFLTDTSGGVTTKVTGKIKGISDGTSVFSAGSLTVECNENFITGSVVRNDGIVEGTIEDAKFQSNLTSENTHCKSSLGNTTVTIPALTNEALKTGHWCIKTGAGDTFSVFGRNCGVEGNGVLTFILDIGGLECGYKREAAVTGTFTTPSNHTASTLSLNESVFVRHVGGVLCPAEGKITTMKFNLYTDTASSAETGGNFWDDAASTGDPVWASEKE